MVDVEMETTAIQCGPCIFDGDTVDPKHFCVDCLDYMCTGCAREHRKHKSSREHKILDDIPQDVKLFEEMKQLSVCLTHPGIQLEKYCGEHNVLICPYCLINEHIVCKNLADIDQTLDEKWNDTDCNSDDMINKLTTECRIQREETNEISEAMAVNLNDVKEEITTFVKSVKDTGQNLEKKLNEQHEQLILTLTQSLSKSGQTLSRIEHMVTRYEKLFALTSKFGSEKESIVVKFMTRRLLDELKASDTLKEITTKRVKFILPMTSIHLLGKLQECDVVLTGGEQLGVQMHSDEVILQTRDIAIQVDKRFLDEQQTSKLLNSLQMTSYIRTYKIQTNQDVKTCNTLALEVLSDGRIIWLDDENGISLSSNKHTQMSSFSLRHKPKDMCVIEDKQDGIFTVAVCFDALNKITIIEYGDAFCERYDISCSQNVVCLTMYVHHLAVVVESMGLYSRFEIQLLDISTGHVCYSFDEFKNNRDGSSFRFTKPKRICLSKMAKTIIIADEYLVRLPINDGDCCKDTLTAVGPCDLQLNTTDTKSLQTFSFSSASFKPSPSHRLVSAPSLSNRYVSDVKFDSQGNLYYIQDGAVTQISSEHNSQRTIIQNCENGSAIYIDEIRKRIVVGYSCSNRIHIYQYKLE